MIQAVPRPSASSVFNRPARVTWLLPVKNGMPFLTATLLSVETQSYREFTMLAWDNGSTDGSVEELLRWIPSRIPGEVVTGQPLGLGASLATMVARCETEYCARIDADDINHPERLRRQIAFLDAYPEVAVLGAQMRHIDVHSADLGPYEPYGPTLPGLPAYPCGHKQIVLAMLRGNSMAHPSVLFRRDSVMKAGNYRNFVAIEDLDLWLRVAKGDLLANLPEELVSYRVHARSVTQQALAAHALEPKVTATLGEHAEIFGLQSHEVRRFRSGHHAGSSRMIQKAVVHIFRDPDWRRCLKRNFVDFKSFVPTRDFSSRLALARADPRPGSLSREIWRLGDHLARALWRRSPLPAARHWLQTRPNRRRMAQWRRHLISKQCDIDRRLEVSGRQDAFNFVEIQKWSTVERDVSFWLCPAADAEPRLSLGQRSFVGRNTSFAIHRPIVIGSNVLIGAFSYISSAAHCYERRDIPIRDQGFSGQPIVIEDDVWIGTHVVILPGVTIGKGAIIGAGSVVTRSVPAYEVWAGSPAHFLKHRP